MFSINNNYLISNSVDFILIGGAALLTFLIITIFNLNLGLDIVFIMFVLAFFVNSPHFMISYQIFYSSGLKKVFNKSSFFFVGFIIPIILIMIISVGMYYQNDLPFLFMLVSMFFLVGWHYIKQTYGCFIVYSAGNKIYYSKLEQNLIKFSLYPLWIFSFLKLFTSDHVQNFWGLEYKFPNFLSDFTTLMGLASIIGFFVFILLIMYGYFFKRIKPNLIALTPMIIIYIWMSPIFWHEIYFYMIPFFHSLQYFLFTGAYTKNKIKKESLGTRGWLMWWGGAFVSGAVFFEFLPKYLDSIFYQGNSITSNLFLISFIFFINIHHYFIDSVIWRGSNLDVRENLKFNS